MGNLYWETTEPHDKPGEQKRAFAHHPMIPFVFCRPGFNPCSIALLLTWRSLTSLSLSLFICQGQIITLPSQIH